MFKWFGWLWSTIVVSRLVCIHVIVWNAFLTSKLFENDTIHSLHQVVTFKKELMTFGHDLSFWEVYTFTRVCRETNHHRCLTCAVLETYFNVDTCRINSWNEYGFYVQVTQKRQSLKSHTSMSLWWILDVKVLNHLSYSSKHLCIIQRQIKFCLVG